MHKITLDKRWISYCYHTAAVGMAAIAEINIASVHILLVMACDAVITATAYKAFIMDSPVECALFPVTDVAVLADIMCYLGVIYILEQIIEATCGLVTVGTICFSASINIRPLFTIV